MNPNKRIGFSSPGWRGLLFFTLGLSTLSVPAAESAARKPGSYPLGPDSLVQAGVPQGTLEGPLEWHSRIFPGTVRRYWIFVPAQYTADKPACLLVFQDGQRAIRPDGPLRVPQVMANLIHKGDMPVTIGLFVTPGNLSERYPDELPFNQNPDNRSREYDTLSDTYARMLIEEFIPELAKKYHITDQPEGRAIGGTSSGGICAWTVAWERPDQFRKVISMTGSYVSIAYQPARGNQPMVPGGELYPTLIRRNPPKPIRIFLQDGSGDTDFPGRPGAIHGNWFLGNQQMLAALTQSNVNADWLKLEGPRYDVNHVWGDGTHSDQHGGSLLPDILRWLWRDWPQQ